MNIRKAIKEDLPVLQCIYEKARCYMRDHGNMNQWVNGYPSEALLTSDIEKDTLYVVEADGVVRACFVLAQGPDPTYHYINGNWLNNEDYYVIHRIASDGSIHGVLACALSFAESIASNIRIDTHNDNQTMQNQLIKNGFTYCGIIYLENGDPRLAYQKTF